MKCKKGVTLFGIKPEMLVALFIIDEVYADLVGQGVTVTAVTDGIHTGLPHYLGFAVDCRTRDDDSIIQWPDELKEQIAQEIRDRLTDEFDVVVESTHIHTEYDPR